MERRRYNNGFQSLHHPTSTHPTSEKKWAIQSRVAGCLRARHGLEAQTTQKLPAFPPTKSPSIVQHTMSSIRRRVTLYEANGHSGFMWECDERNGMPP